MEKGLAETKSNTIWNYKFRILKAHLLAVKEPSEAIALLGASPPTELASEEFGVRRLLVLGVAFDRLGNTEESNRCFGSAERLAGQSYPDLLANIQNARGFLAELHGKPDDAQKYYESALRFAEKYKEPWLAADALNNLGNLQLAQEHYDNSADDFSKALELASSATARYAEERALGNLGWSYYQLGDFNRAILFLEAAEAAASRIKRIGDQQLFLTDLGSVYFSYEDYDKAKSYYLKAYDLAVTSGDNSLVVKALRELAQIELERNDLGKAEEYNRQVTAGQKSISEPKWQALCNITNAEIAIRRNELSKAEQLLKPLSISAPNLSIQRRAESDLAAIYVAEKKTRAAEAEFEAAIRTVEKARSEVHEEERRMSILDAWPFYDDYIKFLFDRKKDRKALEIAEFSRSRTLAEGLGIAGPEKAAAFSIQKVQAFLKQQNKTVLAYWLADKESYLWVIGPAAFKSFRLPHSRNDIEREIQAYNAKVLDHRGINDAADGQKLYEMLVRRAARFVPKGSRVIIIPNRGLYKLNFETLVIPSPKPHYWIEDVTIEVAGSIALLARSHRPKSGPSRKLLLIGAPLPASSEFPGLTHADEEMEKVKAHFPSAEEKILSGKDATPGAYESLEAKLFQFIHFVTHGTASQTSPLDSAIILSPQADQSFKLYAREIIKDHLNADLVTISACYGAGTRTYSGEGLVGLAWAFLRAGAHRVVAGLWEVDDSATPDLMDHFYANLKHEGAARSLRDAKLKMVHASGVYRLPYYWGSLQLYTGS